MLMYKSVITFKITQKGNPVLQKVMPRCPEQVSICDELGVRMCYHQYHQNIINSVIYNVVLPETKILGKGQ